MSKRQLTLQFELDEQLADKLTRTGLLDNPEQWFQTRTTYSDTVAGYLRFIKHELSSDLSAMLGYSGLLQRLEVNPQQQKMFLNSIEKSSRSFQKIITDLTEVEILEVEGAQFKPVAIELDKALQDSLDYIQPLADEKNQDVLVSVRNIRPILSTHYHLARLLEILLMNAVMYTPEGGTIEICAKEVNFCAYLSISDNGIGMTSEEEERVFEKFYRSPSDDVQEQSGLGIGLTIARHLVAGHGGEIWLESKLGVGTTVHLILPLVES